MRTPGRSGRWVPHSYRIESAKLTAVSCYLDPAGEGSCVRARITFYTLCCWASWAVAGLSQISLLSIPWSVQMLGRSNEQTSIARRKLAPKIGLIAFVFAIERTRPTSRACSRKDSSDPA